MAEWATVLDVAEITGRSVSDEQLTFANGLVEAAAFLGRPPVGSVDDVAASDRELLRRAVAFQAAGAATGGVGGLALNVPPDAQSVKLGDASVTFRAGGGTSSAGSPWSTLTGAAAALVESLSWRRKGGPVGVFPLPPLSIGLWADGGAI